MNTLLERVTAYRRDLHKIPEPGYEEHKTREYIYNVLKECSCKIIETKGTGLSAFFKSENPQAVQKTVAFRSDIDGLPVKEICDVEYKSLHDGMMHACGHDGHMAILLAFAKELAARIDTLPCNVLLIFQPAEETTGGAEDICNSGLLETYEVARIFGFHLGPSQPAGSVASRPGPIMAKSSEFNVKIQGKTSHCSTPEKGIDALAIACEFVTALYEMETSFLPPEEFRLLKFGRMESGTVRNAISGETNIWGTLRCYSMDTFQYIRESVRRLADKFQEKYGCQITLSYSEGYPPMINDPELYGKAKALLSEEFQFIENEKPFLTADDFSFFLTKVPGVFFFLGTGLDIPLHSDHFDFDESILVNGVKTYLKLLELPV